MDLSKYEGLLKWEESCVELTRDFIEELYEEQDDRDSILGAGNGYWVGDEVGGVFAWWNYFVDMNNIADYFRYNYTPDLFFGWYDQWAEREGKDAVNMKNFKSLKNET